MPTKTAEILNKAADYIEENGWCRGAFFDPQGQACLMGAIGVASGALIQTKTAKEREQYGLYRWSSNKVKNAAYFAAGAVLAPLVGDKPQLTEVLRKHDERVESERDSAWFQALPVAEQRARAKQWAYGRLSIMTDHVMNQNDGVKSVSGKYRFKTTKSQAVKLLRKAAASAE